jgi:cellulose synthase/poly-beta-1,6-N-acetylglucosamine synthase-like glycosyltransferase
MSTLLAVKALDKLEVASSSRRIGQLFLELGYITQTQLDHALEYQRQKGGRLGWILATLGYVTRLELYEGLAKHFGLLFETDTLYLRQNIDRTLATMFTHEEIVKYQAVPFRLSDNTLLVLTADPDNQHTLGLLRRRFGINQISQVVITDLDLMKISEELYRDSILDMSINGLLYRNPEESAHKIISRPQLIFSMLFLCGLAIWLWLNPHTFLIFALFLIQIFYAVPVLFKLVVGIWGYKRLKQPIVGELHNSGDDYDMPVYTVLVPAYKEAAVIGTMIKALKKLDYPEDKLDIILLLEENDKETLQAAKMERPPANWRFLVLPDSMPKTKPKALNYGLKFAKGEYLTIYDAEDVPEPDQLKKAVAAFRKSSNNNNICFQARLNYFNKNENFLTRMFTLEYSNWFDCLLPGLYRAGLPIPLGGTSNHFDVRKLKQIGAWDPFNVTEDADLGIRASTEGYRVGVIDSTTYEEANSKLSNWIRQRSRWVKGYMQTFLVHNRHPVETIKAIGFWPWFSYNLLIGGTPATFLLSPVMWVLFLCSLFSPILGHLYIPASLLYLTSFNLFAGNVLVILVAMMGVFPRRNYGLLPYALLSPIYWILQSAGAYKGAWQLLTKPFYWEKTTHGITKYKFNLEQKASNVPATVGNIRSNSRSDSRGSSRNQDGISGSSHYSPPFPLLNNK